MTAADVLASLGLVDHHCHGVVTRDLDRSEFEALISEGGAAADGLTNFDSPVGLAIRRHCAPLLDLEPHADPDEYLARRAELGVAEVNRRLIGASGTRDFCVDAGFRSDQLTTPGELAAAAGPGAVAHEVVRLETVAEALANSGVEGGRFAGRYEAALAEAVRVTGAVGVKSIAAYRCGLDITASPPAPATVATAAEHWLDRGPGPTGYRITDRELISALLWFAVDLGLPIQLHVGLGDPDITLGGTDPSVLSSFLRAAPADVPVLFLHCYPFHRSASYLAAVFDQVYLDVGLALNYLGPTRAAALLAEALDLTPFGKMLYSSDAFGVPEFYALGAAVFRRGLAEVLDSRVAAGEWSAADAERVAWMIGAGNAERVYGLARGS
jgi:uncharacterized protein